MVVLAALLALSGLWRPPAPPSRLVTGARRLITACAQSHHEPRLLLTSAGLTTPELRSSFFNMLRGASAPGATPRIAMLVTAQMAPSGTPSKRSPGELRRRRWTTAVKNAREIEKELGVEVECIDCARDADDIELPLTSAECIWVTGGNTFFLWHHMQRRGVDELVRRRVLDEGALYVGQSAGSIVAGATARTALWKGWDDPKAGGALEEVEWTDEKLRCMGLVPKRAFFPHYGAQWDALVEERRGELGRSVELVCLSDDGKGVYVSGEEATDAENEDES